MIGSAVVSTQALGLVGVLCDDYGHILQMWGAKTPGDLKVPCVRLAAEFAKLGDA